MILNDNKKKILDITLSILHSIFYLFFAFTLGITFILFCRSFFYMCIDLLNLTYYADRTYAELKLCYDSLMDSLIFFEPFSLGNVFIYSEEGMNHFLDCVPLFLLNNIVFLISSIGLIITTTLLKLNKFTLLKFKNFSLKSWISFGVLFLLLIIVIWALINFYSLFTCFHNLFFPGKTNWIFYPSKDPVINMFQESFFALCAGLIGTIFGTLLLIPIIKDIYLIIKNKKTKKEIENI